MNVVLNIIKYMGVGIYNLGRLLNSCGLWLEAYATKKLVKK